ncbi:FkbM family methyltransferase [Thermogutta sp.]|uniref:FkbM family methyltransferase n=1 Tax=Thermogutta sp. TaxID=1962930 RepID=UPI003C7E7451
MVRFFSQLSHKLRTTVLKKSAAFYHRERVRQLCAESGIPPDRYPLELLETLLSIRALVTNVPPVLLDVGAHRGIFAQLAHRLIGFRRIICIEADKDLVAESRHRNPSSNVTIICAALDERESAVPFYVHHDRTMSSLVPADQTILKEKFPNDAPEPIAVRMVHTKTLDQIVEQIPDLHGSFFLKLDTQGNELRILRGAPDTLMRTEVILTEFMFYSPYRTDYSFRDLVDFLSDHGFECAGALSLTRRPSHEISAVDFLFKRREVATHSEPAAAA